MPFNKFIQLKGGPGSGPRKGGGRGYQRRSDDVRKAEDAKISNMSDSELKSAYETSYRDVMAMREHVVNDPSSHSYNMHHDTNTFQKEQMLNKLGAERLRRSHPEDKAKHIKYAYSLAHGEWSHAMEHGDHEQAAKLKVEVDKLMNDLNNLKKAS